MSSGGGSRRSSHSGNRSRLGSLVGGVKRIVSGQLPGEYQTLTSYEAANPEIEKETSSPPAPRKAASHDGALTMDAHEEDADVPSVVVENRDESTKPLETPMDDKVDEDVAKIKLAINKKDLPPLALRREVWAWYMYDFGNSVYAYSAQQILYPGFISSLAKYAADEDENVFIGSIPVNQDSVYAFAVTVSVILQLALFMLLGGMADYGAWRKKMLIWWTIAAAVLFSANVFVHNDGWWLCATIFIFATAAYNVAYVFYNSFLPLLVQAHPHNRYWSASDDEIRQEEFEGQERQITKLHLRRRKVKELVKNRLEKYPKYHSIPGYEEIVVDEDLLKELSNEGLITGFVGGFVMIVFNVVVFIVVGFILGADEEDDIKPTTEWWGFRVNFFLCGIYWLLMNIYPFMYLKPRESPPAKGNIILASVKELKHTWTKVRRLPQTLRFLLAYFVFSDGEATVAAGAAVLAINELGLSATLLAVSIVEVQMMALIGCYLFLYLAQHPVYGKVFTSRNVIITNLMFMSIVPVWAFVALRNKWEFFGAAGLYGFHLGSRQAFSRQVYTQMIPIQYAGQFFSFYEVTDKGTAWLGPVVLGVVTTLTGDIRWGLLAIIAFFFIGTALLLLVDVEKGITQAIEYTVLIAEKRKSLGLDPAAAVNDDPFKEDQLEKALEEERIEHDKHAQEQADAKLAEEMKDV